VDGHRYIRTAYEAGCRYFLCERETEELQTFAEPTVHIIVEDTVEALSMAASGYRQAVYPHLQTVGITGSVGKTTTKECVSAVLSCGGMSLFRKEGNYNSTIGLPLSMMEIPQDTGVAVLEMGMSGRGEIHTMSQAAAPRIGIITNVGTSHLEYLGSRENIAKAKLEICDGLQEGGVLLVNGDEPLLQGVESERFRVMTVSASGTTADFSAERIRLCEQGMCFDAVTPNGRYNDLLIPAVGRHMVWAAMFAVAAGVLMGETDQQIRQGLASYRGATMRQHIRRSEGVTIIEDCYNAAPESMKAALEVLGIMEGGRHVAILGDMKELGDTSEFLHRTVGAACVSCGVDRLITVGEMGRWIAEGAVEAGMDPSHIWATGASDLYEDIALKVKNELKEGDAVLVKASRSMALEKMAELL
jgi:UDP-N-acetylmuramoyl-tripeptide--D-alanyl-D-alanine ligase